MSDYLYQFRQAIEASGLPTPADIHDDAKLHRFSTNGKRGDDSGWYVLHSDGIPAGSFGCWRSGLQLTWCAKSDDDLTNTERQEIRGRVKAMQRQREAEQARVHEQAMNTAAERLAQSQPVAEYPYLTNKGIKPHGVKALDGRLVIPVRDSAGTLRSLQTIGPDGDKRFLAGGKVSGCYFSIGNTNGATALCIAEGFATGATIHEATGLPVAVAFNAGNLLPVAKAMREKFPSLRLILCADDDAETPGNPGLTKATEAARAVGGLVAIPDFGRAAA